MQHPKWRRESTIGRMLSLFVWAVSLSEHQERAPFWLDLVSLPFSTVSYWFWLDLNAFMQVGCIFFGGSGRVPGRASVGLLSWDASGFFLKK